MWCLCQHRHAITFKLKLFLSSIQITGSKLWVSEPEYTCMWSKTASAAWHTSGPPANVLPWSPLAIVEATASVTRTAPIGSPPANGFASVMISGFTSKASWAQSLPVRPSPHCTYQECTVMKTRNESAHSILFYDYERWHAHRRIISKYANRLHRYITMMNHRTLVSCKSQPEIMLWICSHEIKHSLKLHRYIYQSQLVQLGPKIINKLCSWKSNQSYNCSVAYTLKHVMILYSTARKEAHRLSNSRSHDNLTQVPTQNWTP